MMIDDSSMRIAITNVKAEKSKVAAVDKTSHISTWEAVPAFSSKAKAGPASYSKVICGETHHSCDLSPAPPTPLVYFFKLAYFFPQRTRKGEGAYCPAGLLGIKYNVIVE